MLLLYPLKESFFCLLHTDIPTTTFITQDFVFLGISVFIQQILYDKPEAGFRHLTLKVTVLVAPRGKPVFAYLVILELVLRRENNSSELSGQGNARHAQRNRDKIYRKTAFLQNLYDKEKAYDSSQNAQIPIEEIFAQKFPCKFKLHI